MVGDVELGLVFSHHGGKAIIQVIVLLVQNMHEECTNRITWDLILNPRPETPSQVVDGFEIPGDGTAIDLNVTHDLDWFAMQEGQEEEVQFPTAGSGDHVGED